MGSQIPTDVHFLQEFIDFQHLRYVLLNEAGINVSLALKDTYC